MIKRIDFERGNYEGEVARCADGTFVPHGQGTLYFGDGDKRYEGEWQDGKRHGQGMEYYANGNKYKGEFCDGKANGQGTLYFPNGGKYVGEFCDGKKHGQGIYYFANGNMMSGEWRDDEYIKNK